MFVKLAAAVASIVLSVCAASAAERSVRYENARFGYAIEVPPGFSKIVEADNSDGGTAGMPKGDGRLAVWGAWLLDQMFADEVQSRINSDAIGGWSVSYRSIRRGRASWSASKGGRIAYSRAIQICEGQGAYFRLEYDRAAARSYDRIAVRLARSLRATGRCP